MNDLFDSHTRHPPDIFLIPLDPRLSVISGTLPMWAVTLPKVCPFLFSWGAPNRNSWLRWFCLKLPWEELFGLERRVWENWSPVWYDVVQNVMNEDVNRIKLPSPPVMVFTSQVILWRSMTKTWNLKAMCPKTSYGNLESDFLEDWNFENHESREKKHGKDKRTLANPWFSVHSQEAYGMIIRFEDPQDAHEVHCIRSLLCGALDTGDIFVVIPLAIKFSKRQTHVCWCILYDEQTWMAIFTYPFSIGYVFSCFTCLCMQPCSPSPFGEGFQGVNWCVDRSWSVNSIWFTKGWNHHPWLRVLRYILIFFLHF